MNYVMFFAKDGKAIHQYHGIVPLSVCLTAPDLAGQLPHFAIPTAMRQVQAKQFVSEFPIHLGTVETRDGLNSERQSPIEFRSTKDKEFVAALSNGAVFETPHFLRHSLHWTRDCHRLAIPPINR